LSRKGGLGRGLEALLPESGLQDIPVARIRPNPLQPRQTLADDELAELAASIREHGILQPVVVSRQPEEGVYLLIVGERRWRAAQKAGMATIPALVRPTGSREALEIALVENLQRAALSPLETAEAYAALMSEFGTTQEQVAARVGKSRSAVANTLRLLRLAEAAKDALAANSISEGHARALLRLTTEMQTFALAEIIRRDLNVRQTERLVKRLLGSPQSREQKPLDARSAEWADMLRHSLATKVEIQRRGKRGTIRIHFYSDEELEGLVDRLLVEET
jgi:ParB family chromosome partitioning protein